MNYIPNLGMESHFSGELRFARQMPGAAKSEGPEIAAAHPAKYQTTIKEICSLGWQDLNSEDLAAVAQAYYFFSVQFRENLQIARELFPEDGKLKELEREECGTSNLSPWPGVALPGEKMNHDEFMRRLLLLSPEGEAGRHEMHKIGQLYLDKVRHVDPMARALSIASYEDGGLEQLFRAILQPQRWDGPLLEAFRHFLLEHIRFDSDAEHGHGALSRHIVPDDRILPLWTALRELLLDSVPALRVAASVDAAVT